MARPVQLVKYVPAPVRGYGSRGTGRCWHYISRIGGDGEGLHAPHGLRLSGPDYPNFPYYVSMCGSVVETEAQIEAAINGGHYNVYRPRENLPICFRCSVIKTERIRDVLQIPGPDPAVWQAARVDAARRLLAMISETTTQEATA